jgi:hypothetical protein
MAPSLHGCHPVWQPRRSTVYEQVYEAQLVPVVIDLTIHFMET